MLTSRNLSLLVIDSSCDQDGGGMSPLQVIILALPPKKNTQKQVCRAPCSNKLWTS